MKKAIATIETEAGAATIYYNGRDEEMTAEAENIVEEIGCCPETIEEAIATVYAMYGSYEWNLEIIY